MWLRLIISPSYIVRQKKKLFIPNNKAKEHNYAKIMVTVNYFVSHMVTDNSVIL